MTTEKEAYSVDSKPEVVEIPTLSTKVRKDSDNYYWVDAPNGVANEIFTENTRVHITNMVTPSKKGIRDERDHCATVKYIDYHRGDTRVHFVTDNGFNTWRFPKYLGLLYTNNKGNVEVTKGKR